MSSMNKIDDNPGGISRPDPLKTRGREELIQWMEAYRASVGPAASGCEQILHDLLDSKALVSSSIDPLLELLEVLEILSADPVTISCAMLHVAGQEKEVTVIAVPTKRRRGSDGGGRRRRVRRRCGLPGACGRCGNCRCGQACSYSRQ